MFIANVIAHFFVFLRQETFDCVFEILHIDDLLSWSLKHFAITRSQNVIFHFDISFLENRNTFQKNKLIKIHFTKRFVKKV